VGACGAHGNGASGVTRAEPSSQFAKRITLWMISGRKALWGVAEIARGASKSETALPFVP
jgi:hypothetical protein